MRPCPKLPGDRRSRRRVDPPPHRRKRTSSRAARRWRLSPRDLLVARHLRQQETRRTVPPRNDTGTKKTFSKLLAAAGLKADFAPRHYRNSARRIALVQATPAVVTERKMGNYIADSARLYWGHLAHGKAFFRPSGVSFQHSEHLGQMQTSDFGLSKLVFGQREHFSCQCQCVLVLHLRNAFVGDSIGHRQPVNFIAALEFARIGLRWR